MALSKNARSPHSPSPIYGIRPGFTVGDLEGQYRHGFRVYGTFTAPITSDSAGLPTNTWNAVNGAWNPLDMISAQKTNSDVSGTQISPHARAIKVAINVTGTGTVDVIVKSNVDSFTATIADFGALSVGTYSFYLGGYSSVDSDGTSYGATQYGPVKAGFSPAAADSTGDEETTHPDPSADSNYVGGIYNPFRFLSLDGYDLKFFSTVVGSVGYDVTVVTMS